MTRWTRRQPVRSRQCLKFHKLELPARNSIAAIEAYRQSVYLIYLNGRGILLPQRKPAGNPAYILTRLQARCSRYPKTELVIPESGPSVSHRRNPMQYIRFQAGRSKFSRSNAVSWRGSGSVQQTRSSSVPMSNLHSSRTGIFRVIRAPVGRVTEPAEGGQVACPGKWIDWTLRCESNSRQDLRYRDYVRNQRQESPVNHYLSHDGRWCDIH